MFLSTSIELRQRHRRADRRRLHRPGRQARPVPGRRRRGRGHLLRSPLHGRRLPGLLQDSEERSVHRVQRHRQRRVRARLLPALRLRLQRDQPVLVMT